MRHLPNILTLIRLLASPFLAWLLLRSHFPEALGLVLLAGLTDWFDGFAARRLNVRAPAGVILDPLADKAMLVTLFVALTVIERIPWWMLALVIARDLVIVTGALLLRAFRNVGEFVPTTLGKISTFFQLVLVFLVLLDACFPCRIFFLLRMSALALSTFFTAASGLDYIRLGVEMAWSTQRTGRDKGSISGLTKE